MNIARLRRTAFVVTVALLAQTAMAAASAPCGGSHQATASAHGPASAQGHGPHATHHDMSASNTHDGHGADKRPDCCKGMGPAGCAAGGCALFSGAMLIPPATIPWAPHAAVTARRVGNWLPSYGSPPSGIFRPPIA